MFDTKNLPQVWIGDGMFAKFCKEGEEKVCLYAYCTCQDEGLIPLRKATEEEAQEFWYFIGQEAGKASSKW